MIPPLFFPFLSDIFPTFLSYHQASEPFLPSSCLLMFSAAHVCSWAAVPQRKSSSVPRMGSKVGALPGIPAQEEVTIGCEVKVLYSGVDSLNPFP